MSEPLTKEFVPRIPSNTIHGEDETIPRICFSDSIENCLNATEDKLLDYDNMNTVPIIVWEMDFSLPNNNLVAWQELYKKNLVPDAVFTHEYWFLEKLQLEGHLFEIHNIDDAISSKKEVYVINEKYKEVVLDIFLDFGISLEEIQKYDLYYLVNEWLPTNNPEKMDYIIARLKEKIRVIDNTDSCGIYTENSSAPKKKRTVSDIYCQKVYHNLVIRRKI